MGKIYSQMLTVTHFESYCRYYHFRRIFVICLGVTISILMFFIIPRLSLTNPRLLSDDNIDLPEYLQCPHHSRNQLACGRSHFARSRVIICGMVRDRENRIVHLRKKIESITKLFADYAVVIVENDSIDRTRYELIRWAEDEQVRGRIHVIGCENHRVNDHRPCNMSLASTQPKAGSNTSRIEKMVRLRNIYMKYLEDNSQFTNYDYVLVQDFDLWSFTYIDGLLSTGFYLSTDPTIDAICANGILHNQFLSGTISLKTYFDPYAHKEEFDYNWKGNYKNLWSSIFRYYPCNSQLKQVQSCFSGQTIYRYQSIKDKRYRTYLDFNQQAICEHVGLHETLNKIYLNSEMIFYIMENNL